MNQAKVIDKEIWLQIVDYHQRLPVYRYILFQQTAPPMIHDVIKGSE